MMNANITLLLDSALLQPTAAFFPWGWIFGPVIGAILAWLFDVIFNTPPSRDMRRILILGTAGAGKTTLWSHLRNRAGVGVGRTTTIDGIKEFELGKNSEGEPIYVEQSTDVGGTKDYVHLWKDWIKSNSFLLFVVDICDLDKDEMVQDIRARMQVIAETLKNEGLENVAMYVIGTHIDQANKTEAHYRGRLRSVLGDKVKDERVLIGDLSKRDGCLYQTIYGIIKDNILS